MSKADEMFEKMGYEKIRKDNDTHEIRYVRRFTLKRPRHVIFLKLDKTISVCEENQKELAVNRDWFSMQELQAINEKCRELGWLDDYRELGKDLASNFIAKEVIREKLEELKENLNTVEHYETVGAIQILKEILEGEKK